MLKRIVSRFICLCLSWPGLDLTRGSPWRSMDLVLSRKQELYSSSAHDNQWDLLIRAWSKGQESKMKGKGLWQHQTSGATRTLGCLKKGCFCWGIRKDKITATPKWSKPSLRFLHRQNCRFGRLFLGLVILTISSGWYLRHLSLRSKPNLITLDGHAALSQVKSANEVKVQNRIPRHDTLKADVRALPSCSLKECAKHQVHAHKYYQHYMVW